MAEKAAPDWEAIEREYRAGIRSLADIGKEFGVSAPGILKRARKDDWVRDLSAKIKAKAEAKVNASLVNGLVNGKAKETERQIVEANADAAANAVLRERADVSRARSLAMRLLGELEAATEQQGDFARLGELLAAPDDKGVDKLGDLYKKVIAMPSRIDGVKKLSDALKVLIELERKVLKLDDLPPDSVESAARGAAEGAARASVPGLADALEAFRAK